MKTVRIVTAVLLLFIGFTSCQSHKDSPYVPITDADIKPEISAVMHFLKKQDYANNPDWYLFPGTDVSGDTLKRLGLPVHGRWVRTYVNKTAHEFLKQAKNPDISQPLEFPPGSFIVKQNYRSDFDKPSPISPDNSTLGAITVLYKPDPSFNYCATPLLERYNGVDCYGGNWFYGFFFQSDLVEGKISQSSQTIQDNVNTFCVNCHAPGFNTDYVRTLDDIRNPFALKSSEAYCDSFRDKSSSEKHPAKTERTTSLFELTAEVATFIEDVELSPELPTDVPADPTLVFNEFGADFTQAMFNNYAWKSFIALNWPNKGPNANDIPQRGEANTKLPFVDNEKMPTVWETYKPTFEVFQPGNISWNPVDQPWNQKLPQIVGDSCNTKDFEFVITMGSKARDVVNETGQAFAGSFGYLVDQDSTRVRYEVLFNRTEFEYLVGDGRAASLNLTPSGPKGLANKVNFPDNRDDNNYNEGAMEVKSAWKELCLTADCNQRDALDLKAAKKRFLVRNALIYDSETGSCRTAPMALVGLHIARKTYYAPQWIWITFEHKDNVPDAGAENPTGTFYNPNLKELDNCYQLPFLYKDPAIAGCPNVDLNRFIAELKDSPNQLTRLVPIDTIAQQLNASFQAELAKVNSPFANYVLVNTQWALNGRQQDGTVSAKNCSDNGMGEDCFTMVPRFLRNSVIESYMSAYCEVDGKPKQVSNRSCMSCHGNAGADLSYVYLDAVSQRVQLVDSIPKK